MQDGHTAKFSLEADAPHIWHPAFRQYGGPEFYDVCSGVHTVGISVI